jgi:hypothetical protein
MAVTSIEARCRRCRQDFELIELRTQHNGTCPRCGWALAPDWTDKLLYDATAADAGLRLLVRSLRSMSNLPGNVALQPHSVLRNLVGEVGWEDDLTDDPDMLERALHEVRRLLDTWELLDPVVAAAQPRRTQLQRAVDWFTGRPQPRVIRADHARQAQPTAAVDDPRTDRRRTQATEADRSST